MSEKTFFKNRIRRATHSIEIEKIKEHFITPISSLLVDGVDFAIFRVYKTDPTDHSYNYDICYEWSWDWLHYENMGHLSEGIDDVIYDEVETNGEGYYLATVLTEQEWSCGEDESISQCYWKTADKFIMFVPLEEIEPPKSHEMGDCYRVRLVHSVLVEVDFVGKDE